MERLAALHHDPLSFLFKCVFVKLYSDSGYVLHSLDMPHGNTIMPIIFHSSYGTHLLDHLAADGACFAGGQVAVVAVGQVDAHFPWCPFYLLNSLY